MNHRRIRTRTEQWLHSASIGSCILAGIAASFILYHVSMFLLLMFYLIF